LTQERERIRRRLIDETGRIDKRAPFAVGLAYPSPYAAGMSSLGYQRIYRAIQEASGFCAERLFLDDSGVQSAAPLSYESLRPLSDFPVVAFSVAYELELAGVVKMLDGSGVPVRRGDRTERHPLVIAGGPLTFSNPSPLSGIVDAIIMGEAEQLTIDALALIEGCPSRQAQLDALASLPHIFVPTHHTLLPPVAAADNVMLPAWAPIRTPHTEFSNMFLIETERGCSRGCAYCVMRRTTNGGMRIAPMERVLELIPPEAKRVGLVGAAVSDHPKIVDIVNALADRGCEVGLSSLRPDRLSDAFVGALKRAGYRTLTTAMDGTSERVRDFLDRRARPKHLLKAAEMARLHKMDRLKLYLMIGVPGETDEDIDECVAFVTELSKIVPIALGIAPFCSKRNTPLDLQPYAGIDVVDARLARLKRGLRGRADVRSTSAKWAWVEYVLAQGGEAEGLAVIEAVRSGGTFASYRRAFDALGHRGAPSVVKPARRSLPLSAVGR
jgi:radical SAM superfamily enzyme YgiQ (UPF0313 family)